MPQTTPVLSHGRRDHDPSTASCDSPWLSPLSARTLWLGVSPPETPGHSLLIRPDVAYRARIGEGGTSLEPLSQVPCLMDCHPVTVDTRALPNVQDVDALSCHQEYHNLLKTLA